jgi:small subunit ribosomal protein S11
MIDEITTEEVKIEESPKSEIKTETETKKSAASKEPKGKLAKKKKEKKQIAHGRAYIQATYNNTIVTLTDQNGNVLSWSSAGHVGFKGPKKATPYAAGIIVKDCVEKVQDNGLKDVNVFVKGVGSGREAAVRALNANGLNVLSIKDVTPIPHGGCRAKKPRRI